MDNSRDQYFKTVLDAFPSPVFVMDRDLRIYDTNDAALEIVGADTRAELKRLCGELLKCLHARRSEGGCGTTPHCADCVIRQTVQTAAIGGRGRQQLSEMSLERDGGFEKVWYIVSGMAFAYRNEERVILTLQDVTELVELRRLLPICSHCRKIRDDDNYWHQVETYFLKYSGVRFTHGICPECRQEHFPELEPGR